MNASIARGLHEKSVWETLSLEEALTSMEQMHEMPSVESLASILHRCRTLKNLAYTKRLYAYMCVSGLKDHRVLGNYLVELLVQVGSMYDAQQVFSRLVNRNVYSWTSLISGYIECGELQHALNLFKGMQEDCVHPDKYTYVAILKACGRLKSVERGREIHAKIARKGLERDLFIGSTLVDMYAKCSLPAEAQEAFDKLPVRDVVSWNALITGYAEDGLGEEALNCLERMSLDGLFPNAVTFVCSLKACGSIGAINRGQKIHAETARKGLEKHLFVGSTLVDMYAKCGLLTKAGEVFDKLPVRNEVSWNALIAGYTEHGLGEVALNCFEQMQLECVPPNIVTFVCSLKACGSVGAIHKGRKIHSEIVRKGLEGDLFVGSTLVDMYAQCAALLVAQEAFDMLPVRDVVSWSALMAGYAQLGECEIVLDMLERMTGEGVKPNAVTFSVLLTVCSHTGLVDKGQKYFEAMSEDYGITPTIKHHIEMIDILGRAGLLYEAIAMVKKMPFHPNVVAWTTVLGACQKWGDVELGRVAFEHAVQLDEKDAVAYVLMANIYADAHMLEEERAVEAMRVKQRAWKVPGQCWWTDMGGTVHTFLVGGTRHPQSENIYAKLKDLALKMRAEGYLPPLDWMSPEVSADPQKDGLCGHSERLAIACALINSPKGSPIRVVKNLRICKDCHAATALISKMEQLTILIRDANRCHVFKGGKCACGDYW